MSTILLKEGIVMVKCHLSSLMGTQRLKISELVIIAGLTPKTVWSIYHEKAKRIDFATLGKLCAALDCQPGDLLEYIPDKR